MVRDYRHALPWCFLHYLAQGWNLPFIVQPLQSHHGRYSMLLWRDVGD